jgi:murein DD-endopeptidase MepM/ murein hydrolase activator NlpD
MFKPHDDMEQKMESGLLTPDIPAEDNFNEAQYDESALLGKTVTIDHGNGIIIKYCGLENILVSTGKKVNMGDSIAVVGNVPSECADNSHIHLEATKNGEVVSPLDVIGKIPE